MSESALSHRLRSLEDALTIALFHRSSEGVEPTNAGLAFFGHAREALRMLDLAMANASATSLGTSGRFTLGLYTSLSKGRLRDSLSEFARKHPDIEIQIVEGGRSQMIEGLRARTIDVTVMVGPADPHVGEALPLWREQIFALVAKDHPLADRPELDWTQIAGEPFLFSTRDAGPEAESALVAQLGGPGHWPTRRLHTATRETLRALVALGHGLAVMIESDLGQIAPDVVAIPLRDALGLTLERLTAYRDPSNDNPPLRRFWSMLKSRYSEGG